MEETIESEAERLFGDDSPKAEIEWKKDPDQFEKYELVKITFRILSSEDEYKN